MRTLATLLMMLMIMAAAAILPACNAVQMSADFSRLLDETAALSTETAARAQAGKIDAGAMRDALVYQAYVWRTFKAAKDGIQPEADIPTPAPTTQPAALLDLVPGLDPPRAAADEPRAEPIADREDPARALAERTAPRPLSASLLAILKKPRPCRE